MCACVHNCVSLDHVWFIPSLATYSSGQNKVPTAELKSRLIVVQKSFDSRSIVAQWKIVSAYAPVFFKC